MTVLGPVRVDSPAAAAARRLLAPVLGVRGPAIGRDPLPPRLRPRARLGVLDITEFFGESSGGVRTYLMEKAAYVERRPELRHVLVVPGAADSITELPGVRCYRLRGPRVPTQHPYRFMLATRSNRRILEHERPDVIEVGSPGLAPWIIRAPAAQLGIPLVHFFHSNYPTFVRGRLPRWLTTHYARSLDRLFVTTIVASRVVADDLRRKGIDRVVHVPLGVDSTAFNPGWRPDGMELRARLGIGAGPLAVFAGRFAHEKQLAVLLAAWPAVRAQTGARLLLIGDGPLRRSLFRTHASMLRDGSIAWCSFTNDRRRLAALLASADLFVSPGSSETFGLAALEAMASGTPVLSADQGGVAEQVEACGAGSLFRAGCPAGLATAAIRLLQGDLESMSATARQFAAEAHDWTRVFGRIVGLYESLVVP